MHLAHSDGSRERDSAKGCLAAWASEAGSFRVSFPQFLIAAMPGALRSSLGGVLGLDSRISDGGCGQTSAVQVPHAKDPGFRAAERCQVSVAASEQKAHVPAGHLH